MEASVGNYVWVIEGEASSAGHKQIYRLVGAFVAEECKVSDQEIMIVGQDWYDAGRRVINEETWFDDLFMEMARFSRGFEKAKSPLVIEELSRVIDSAVLQRDSCINSLVHSDELLFAEGGIARTEVNRYERSRSAREACIALYGTRCVACGLVLEERYGPIATGVIEVHHLEPLSDSAVRSTDPIEDLRPVCPNCHRVLHLRQPPLSIAELKELIRNHEATSR